MRINNIIEGTNVNGPGERLCIWVQGCIRNCPGCFNLDACSLDGGKEVSVSELLLLLQKKEYDGISVSGGEPFYQESELEMLLKGAKNRGVNTLVFTGYTYEQLKEKNSPSLFFCDYLIDGPYIKDIPSNCKYTGSGNQRFLHLTKGLIDENLTENMVEEKESEIFITKDGFVITTGFTAI